MISQQVSTSCSTQAAPACRVDSADICRPQPSGCSPVPLATLSLLKQHQFETEASRLRCACAAVAIDVLLCVHNVTQSAVRTSALCGPQDCLLPQHLHQQSGYKHSVQSGHSSRMIHIVHVPFQTPTTFSVGVCGCSCCHMHDRVHTPEDAGGCLTVAASM